MDIINTGMALAQKMLGGRSDPYLAHNFVVEFDTLIFAGFSEVTGLTIQTDVEPVKVGGQNNFEYKFPKGTKQTDLVFKHGITDSNFMWSWYEDIQNGKIVRKNGSIYLLDAQRIPAMWWDFQGAYPIKWEGPVFNAANNTIATESLTFSIQQLIKPAASKAGSLARGALSMTGELSGSISLKL
jgi:phage tail-like protein